MTEEKQADVHFKTTKEWKTKDFTFAPGRSLVHTASREGHLNVVRYLIDHHGCKPSCCDDVGVSPLYLACQQGHMDIVRYLISDMHYNPNSVSCLGNLGYCQQSLLTD